MNSCRLHGLDALRGTAALVVLGYHLRIADGPAILDRGYLAVPLFFLLSGYVMARTYEPGMATRPIGFLWIRVVKLWPPMALGAALGLFFMLVIEPDQFDRRQLIEFLFLPSMTAVYAFALNPPAWSLLQEIVGNIFHAVLFCRVRSAILAILTGWGIAFLVAAQMVTGRASFGLTATDLIMGIAGMVPSYLIGILMWRRWGDSPPRTIPAWLALAIVPAWAQIAPQILDVVFMVLVCPILVASCARSDMSAVLLRKAGAISFPLYAIHYPLLLLLGPLGGVFVSIGLASVVSSILSKSWPSSANRSVHSLQ